MIRVYGSPNCGKCFVAKQKLNDEGIYHEYINLWELPSEEVAEIADKYGTKLPIIIRDGEKIKIEDLI